MTLGDAGAAGLVRQRPAPGATTSSTMAAGGCSNRMPGAVSRCSYKQRTLHVVQSTARVCSVQPRLLTRATETR
jgi:hypothetical protein